MATKNKVVEVEVNHTIDQMIAFSEDVDKDYEDATKNVRTRIRCAFNLRGYFESFTNGKTDW